MPMVSARIGAHRFHLRAAAVVRSQGHVLLHRLEGDPFWALPGGRVDAGECATDALRREFHEELGTDIHCKALLCTGENFFDCGGEPHHEIGLYFEVRLPEGSPLRDLDRVHLGVEGDRTLHFAWFDAARLAAVDCRPLALKDILRDNLRDGLDSGAWPRHFMQVAP